MKEKEDKFRKELIDKQYKVNLLLDEYFESRKFEQLSRTPGPFYMIKDGFLMDNTHKIIHARTPSEMCSYLMLRKVPQSRVMWIDKSLSKQVRHLIAVRLNNLRKR